MNKINNEKNSNRKPKLSDIVSSIINLLKSYLYDYQQKKEYDRQTQIQNQIRNQAYNTMYQLQQELYEVFSGHSYSYLHNIDSYKSIRIYDFEMDSMTGMNYKFALLKEEPSKKIATHFLKEIKRQMDSDIVLTQHELASIDCEYFMTCYPLLFRGLYIVSLSDIGLAEIIISVVCK